mmetsp:Transcript_7468/g.20783  ORF Transcript_7468/g.20783 Transcript_7468/m.20783 type:complete len:207 (+) Transcript_7468:739-1359(+)
MIPRREWDRATIAALNTEVASTTLMTNRSSSSRLPRRRMRSSLVVPSLLRLLPLRITTNMVDCGIMVSRTTNSISPGQVPDPTAALSLRELRLPVSIAGPLGRSKRSTPRNCRKTFGRSTLLDEAALWFRSRTIPSLIAICKPKNAEPRYRSFLRMWHSFYEYKNINVDQIHAIICSSSIDERLLVEEEIFISNYLSLLSFDKPTA